VPPPCRSDRLNVSTPYEQIAAALASEGLPPRPGRAWNATVVNRILRVQVRTRRRGRECDRLSPGNQKPGTTRTATERGKAVNIYSQEADQLQIRELVAYLANEGLRVSDSQVIKAALLSAQPNKRLLKVYQEIRRADQRYKREPGGIVGVQGTYRGQHVTLRDFGRQGPRQGLISVNIQSGVMGSPRLRVAPCGADCYPDAPAPRTKVVFKYLWGLSVSIRAPVWRATVCDILSAGDPSYAQTINVCVSIHAPAWASVITAKAAIRYHFKTGQRDGPKT
jgi:hypothetical protein